MVTGLSQLLAPILSFTADEAWEFVPGKDAQSVHVSDLRPSEFSVPENERQVWKALLKFRDLVLIELEKARQGKMIGKALEARVDWFVEPSSRGSAAKILPDLRELLNVSQIEIRAADSKHVASPARLVFNPQTGDPVDASADPLDGVGIAVLRADGRKCERCWHWETDIGSNPDHPTICGRCVAAVNEYAGKGPA